MRQSKNGLKNLEFLPNNRRNLESSTHHQPKIVTAAIFILLQKPELEHTMSYLTMDSLPNHCK